MKPTALAQLPSRFQVNAAPAEATAARALGFALAMLEALVGHRPLHQVRKYLTDQTFRALIGYTDSGLLRGSQIGRLRLQQPSPAAIEVTASLQLGSHWLACALRLQTGKTWCCQELHVLGLGNTQAAA